MPENGSMGFHDFEGVPVFLPALEKAILLFFFDFRFGVEIENCALQLRGSFGFLIS
jgi:hypothetical protein